MTRYVRIAALATALLAGSCTSLTQIIVVVDSDLDVPGELDSIRIEVRAPSGVTHPAVATLSGDRARPLPRSLGIVYDGGALGPVAVSVFGIREGVEIVQRRARVFFVAGEVRVLRMDLLRACIGVPCAPDETCAENGCRSREVQPSELAPWTGVAQGLDASSGVRDGGDAGMDGGELCVPAEEVCNGRDDDCDDRIDETFDLASDAAHCGACGRACPSEAPHASVRCAASECGLACHPGWEDCDASLATGCEILLSSPASCGGCSTACPEWVPHCAVFPSGETRCVEQCESEGLTTCGGSCVDLATSPQHCGGCDVACAPRAHAAPTCSEGTCAYRCDEGWHDCNGSMDDGCESQLRDLTSCGACGTACVLPRATTTCAGGTCAVLSCESGYGDCDAAPGCETDLLRDPARCGACSSACPADPPNASSACAGGSCVMRCDLGWADCDGRASNGCEAELAAVTSCGACAITCEDPSPVCATTGTGTYACAASCGDGQMLCGGTCADTSVDPRHCGECSRSCGAGPNASPACVAGRCDLLCDAAFGDCNGVAADGCEARLTSATDCGSCGAPCGREHASASCATGSCVLTACEPGWGDCNASASDGCETSLRTTADCGACRAACRRDHASATCVTGSCRIASCDAGWDDCDRADANGCERSLRTSSDCGSCGTICSLDRASESCETGACRIVACEAGWDNCDGLQPNGCETRLTSLTSCGSCGAICSLSQAYETCAALTCAISSCESGWADCDLATTNGCEVDLGSSHGNCGGCAAACLAAESCCGGSCCDGSCCGSSCCPAGRTCCEGVCCAFGEMCVSGSCRRMI